MSVDPVAGLVTARARSIMGRPFAAVAVDAAVDALTSGLDGQALRELAGLSRASADHDVRDLLVSALDDVGEGGEMPHDIAQIRVLRDLTLEVLDGRLELREMTQWAHDMIGHEGPEISEDLVQLDDELDDELGVDSDGLARSQEVQKRLELFISAATEYLADPGASGSARRPSGRNRPDTAVLIAHANMMSADGRLGAAGRILRARLRDDPLDDSIRSALAGIYRAAGHPEQAGRYEITTSSPVKAERDAYLRFLVTTEADEEQIRSLSIVPPNVAIPEQFLSDLEARRRSLATIAPWQSIETSGFWSFIALALVTLVAVYFIAVFDGSSTVFIARLGGQITVAGLGIGFVGLAGCAAIERRRGAAASWASAAISMLAVCAWGAIAVIRG